LKEANPHLSIVVLLSNPASAGFDRYLRTIEDVARPRGIAIQRQSLRTIGEIGTVLAAIRADNRSALLIFPDPSTFAGRGQIAQWALKNRVSTAATFSEFAHSGGFMTYGANTGDLSRRASTYIDRILKGTKPSELPVEQASKFELVINLKTAKALNLTIPPSLLQRADQVIE
jgi:putative ABC transport system substrate-binding protein